MLTVAVQSHNRVSTLRLCVAFLEAAVDRVDFPVVVQIWDDSCEIAVGMYLRASVPRSWEICRATSKWKPLDKAEGDRRCGEKRGRIVDRWLKQGSSPYLLLLDDDIVLGLHTVRDLVRDMNALRSCRKVGALAVHGGHTVHKEFVCGRAVFAHLHLTGEAAVLLNREAVEAVGNQLGPHPKGFADTQWDAFRAGGWQYVTRINPTYSAQHIGIGDGSVIQHGFPAFWLKDLWRANIHGKPWLEVPGFDNDQFLRDVREHGCNMACYRVWRALRTRRGDMGTSGTARKVADSSRLPKGKIRVTVRRERDNVIVSDHEYDNVVLNQAYEQFAHLLAGDDPADRAVNRMQFGSGTTTADVTDTALEIPITPIKAITAVTYPTTRSVKFTAFLLADEANGFPISEIGLLAVNSTLLTRTVTPAVNKSEDYVIEYNYTISWPEV